MNYDFDPTPPLGIDILCLTPTFSLFKIGIAV